MFIYLLQDTKSSVGSTLTPVASVQAAFAEKLSGFLNFSLLGGALLKVNFTSIIKFPLDAERG